MGHPLGGTGAVLTTKLLDEMVKKDYQLGADHVYRWRTRYVYDF